MGIVCKAARTARGAALAAGVMLGVGAVVSAPLRAQTPDGYKYGYTPEFRTLPATEPMHPAAAEMQMLERLNANCGGDATCHFDGTITATHLRGDVWLLSGEPDQSNVVVQSGNDGTVVVDTGVEAMAPELLSAVQMVATQASRNHTAIRWIIDTDAAADHIGGNGVLRKAGRSIVAGNFQQQVDSHALAANPGAVVIGNQNMLDHLVAPPKGMAKVPSAMWPSETHDEPVFSWYFNDEAVRMYHPQTATTNGNTMVLFRGADVLATGDVLDMDTYPVINVAEGGTIDGELAALNHVLELAVPQHQQDIDTEDPGTIIVPGHGHLAVQSDVQHYINVVTVIRNRIMYYKDQGKTLKQVLALKPSWDYDARWGGTKGPWTSTEFVEAVYKTLPKRGPTAFAIPNTPAGGG